MEETKQATHQYYMQMAIDLAKCAGLQGDVPVGAVVVKDNNVIGSGYNRREQDKMATAHAEVLAIQEACRTLNNWRLQDCTLYVTMEPCPMCAGAIVLARIKRLVFGCGDSIWGGCGSIFNIPEHPSTTPKIEILGGIMRTECKTLLTSFFQEKR